MTRFGLIGPTYPFRGGIAHYTTLLARQLQAEHETLLISFSRQYPRWLFPGRSDRDPSQEPLRAPAEYLLDPLNPLSWRRTLRRLDQWAPDVVVIPWWVPFWAPAWAAIGYGLKRLQRPPRLIFICHNVLPHESKPWDVLALRLALRSADGFVAHSSANAEELAHYFPATTVRVAPLPTYAKLSAVKPATLSFGLPADRPLLLFTGFVRPYKGLDILLEAMPRILENRPVHLLVAGEFWQSAEPYLDQIQRLGIAAAVTIENRYLSNEELAAALDLADVVVLPYRTATQSAIIQLAFGSQKPVITTDVGGLAEAVLDGRTGLVVPPDNHEALAAAVIRYFDQELGPKFAANIRASTSRFSWDQLVQQLLILTQESN